MRRTIASSVVFRGVGLHGGAAVAMTVSPAPSGSGILFRRTDAGPAARPIPARHDAVADTRLCTRLANSDGLSVGTVEHLLAALAGCGVTDALICLDAPEVPAMDGSALAFVSGFIRAGFRDRPGPNPALRILQPVEVRTGGKRAALLPAPGFQMDFSIGFADPAIGDQRLALNLTGPAVVRELSDSRTFGLLSGVERLRHEGYGRGGSLENSVIVDRGRVLNPGGLRHPDEFVRHKMLDAVGDLALAGAPIIGRYVGERAGHTLTNLLLQAVFDRPGAWCWADQEAGGTVDGRLQAPVPRADSAQVAV